MKTCRIVSAVLCALCIAALPLVGIFAGFDYIVIPLFGAGLFFTLMLLFRKKHMEQEARTNPALDEATDKAEEQTQSPINE